MSGRDSPADREDPRLRVTTRPGGSGATVAEPLCDCHHGDLLSAVWTGLVTDTERPGPGLIHRRGSDQREDALQVGGGDRDAAAVIPVPLAGKLGQVGG